MASVDVTDPDPPLPVLPPDPDWVARAACRGSDTRVFFPEEKTNTGPARAVCAICPVAAPCLEDALADEDRKGVWGGSSAKQRMLIRRSVKTITEPVEGLVERLDRFELALSQMLGSQPLVAEWQAIRAELVSA